MTASEKKEQQRLAAEAEKRRILFVPCETKEDLHKWIRIFLDFDMPNCVVDPDSNCTPMDMIWEVYDKCRRNDDPEFNRVLYYASRDSFKTLGAAILELLAVVHLGRNVAHMAAIESQSEKSQQYVKSFLAKPVLRDYVIGDNKKKTQIVRYNNQDTGENLTQPEYKALSPVEKSKYTEIQNYINIIICTVGGANSEHVPFFVIDEIDVVRDPRAYEEAQMIPAPINGLMPVTVLTSTRKYSFGLVQRGEIDHEFDDEGNRRVLIRHWNLIDVTQACPPERHLPAEPMIPIFVNDAEIRAISKDAHELLSPEDRAKFTELQGYAGCLKNCRLFAACKGRLATEQKSKSKLLKPIDHTQKMFRTVSIATALAQLLCKKPSTEGLIYPSLERNTHVFSAAKIAEMVTGIPHDEGLTKSQLIKILKAKGLKFYSGMDFGFTHNFAVVTIAVDGAKAYVIDVISQPELQPDQQVNACRTLKDLVNPEIYADPENPQMVALFKSSGFRMKYWIKGMVEDGIDVVRTRLRPPMSEPLLFFLAGDPQVELLVRRMTQYHWKLDASGEVGNVPDEKDDDECDAVRYVLTNRFQGHSGSGVKVAARVDPKTEASATPEGVYTRENWFKKVLEEQGAANSPGGGIKISKGSFKADM